MGRPGNVAGRLAARDPARTRQQDLQASTRPALDNVSVDIDKGEFVFLIGPSGSGKSTFLRLLLREEVPTKGRVYVSNFDVAKMAGRRVPRLRQSIGCVFQDFRLLPSKTVAENVAFALEVIGKPPAHHPQGRCPRCCSSSAWTARRTGCPTSSPVVSSSGSPSRAPS